jgi:RNA polymerase sigma-70 factor (ECF subfamily)
MLSRPSSSSPESDGVTSTSRSLLVRLRDNCADAWDRLVRLYAPLVYSWCRRLGVADQDIPDVIQEVFKSVAASIGTFRKDRAQDTFRGWLRTITRSKAMDHFRRQSRQPAAAAGGSAAQHQMAALPNAAELSSRIDDESDDKPAYHGVFLRACDLIRTDFKEKTWTAFWRVVVDGQSPKDVAEELSMRPGTVRVAKSRVLQRLRQEMGELPE